MTVGYNSGVANCRLGLADSCREEGIYVSENVLFEFSKDFHAFLKNELFGILFRDDRSSIKESNFLNLRDARLNLNYFFIRNKPHKKDIKVGGKR